MEFLAGTRVALGQEYWRPSMGERTESQSRKIRTQALQPVTRFVAAMVLTVVNGRLELRPEQAPSQTHNLTATSR